MPTLNWIGKEAVITHHREVSCRLLEPDSCLGRAGITLKRTPYAIGV